MMKYLFDTSTLVAALVESHIHHDQALPWLQKAHRKEIEGYISVHTIAELYAVISRYPSLQPISPDLVVELIEDGVAGHFEVITLTGDEYRSIIRHLAQIDIVGGMVYDAVIVYAGIKANVDHILSVNAKHFRRVYPSVAHKIIVP
jgi:predicted nucleic acid-binding protein